MKTHVSYNGVLYRLKQIIDLKTADTSRNHYGDDFHKAEFVGMGRLVNPNCSYANAHYVELFKSDFGFISVK